MIDSSAREGRKVNLTLWVLWLLATAGPIALSAMMVYMEGFLDEYVYQITLLLGLLMGVLQSLVLRHYLYSKLWWMWGLLSGVGWIVAMYVLTFGFIFSRVPMMNVDLVPDFEQNLSLQCFWMFSCGVAGAIVGLIQSPYSRRFISIVGLMWTIMSAIAWAIAGYIGRFVAIILYDNATESMTVDYNSPEGLVSTAVGIVVAAIIIGVLTGAGIVSIVYRTKRTGLLAQTLGGSNAT